MKTTTIDKLEQLILHYEQKVLALRLALTELQGTATEASKVNGQLQKAIALRAEQLQQQRPAPPAPERRTHLDRTMVRRQLATMLREARGPLTLRELQTWLAKDGIEASTNSIYQMIDTIPGLRRTGTSTALRRYTLGARSAPKKPVKLQAKKATQRTQHAQWAKKKDPAYWTKEARAERTERARQIVTLARDAGEALTVDEFGQRARQAGIPTLTGIINLVRAGWLQKITKDGETAYRFRTMPPDPVASASPASASASE